MPDANRVTLEVKLLRLWMSIHAASHCRLEDGGYSVGFRLLEVLSASERGGRRRDTRLLDALRFIHGPLWRYLFGRTARDLEQSNTVSCGSSF